MMKTKATLHFLISASLALSGAILSAQDGEPDNAVPERRVPRYEVPPNARDPFFPPATPESEQSEEDASTPAINPEAVRQAVILTAIMDATSRGGTAMLNGGIYRVGETIELEMKGEAVTAVVRRITVNPAAVILELNEQTITVPLTQAANGE